MTETTYREAVGFHSSIAMHEIMSIFTRFVVPLLCICIHRDLSKRTEFSKNKKNDNKARVGQMFATCQNTL